MKINRGKNVSVCSALIFENVLKNEEEALVLKDGMRIKVITDNTDFDEVLEGEFTFVDDDTLDVDGTSIHIDYIEEIIIL